MLRLNWRAGGLLLAGIALMIGGAALDSVTMSRIAALLLAVPVVGLLWVVGAAALTTRPQLARIVSPDRPVVGERAIVRLAVRGGTIPLWARLRERTPAALHRGQARPGSRDRRRWSYQIEPERRGRYVLGPSTVIYGDPLHLLRWHVPADDGEAILVWPRTEPLTHALRRGDLHTNTPARSGSPRRSVEDLTLREYVQGDDVHRVHWRSSARRGQLMVRADEPAAPPAVELVLHLGQQAPGRHIEWAVSAAASLALAFSTDHLPVRIHTCRQREDAPEEVTTATVTARAPAQALDALALARPLPELTQAQRQALRMANRRDGARMGPILVAVLTTPDDEALDHLLTLAPGRLARALIVGSQASAAAATLTRSGWTVTEVMPDARSGTTEIPDAMTALFDQTGSDRSIRSVGVGG